MAVLAFSAIILVIETSLELFFETAETVEKITFSFLLNRYLHNVLIVTIAILVLYPLKFFNIKSTQTLQTLDTGRFQKFF